MRRGIKKNEKGRVDLHKYQKYKIIKSLLTKKSELLVLLFHYLNLTFAKLFSIVPKGLQV